MSTNKPPRRLYLDNEGDVWVIMGYLNPTSLCDFHCDENGVLRFVVTDPYTMFFCEEKLQKYQPTFLLPLEEFMR